MSAQKQGCAFVGSENGFTIFTFGNARIRFRAPYSLEKYVDVKEWDKGYLVLDAKYAHQDRLEEEYIDLVPVLKDLYIEPDEFLSPIQEVRVLHD